MKSSDSVNAHLNKRRKKELPPVPDDILIKYNKPPKVHDTPKHTEQQLEMQRYFSAYAAIFPRLRNSQYQHLDGLLKEVGLAFKYHFKNAITVESSYRNKLLFTEKLHVSLFDGAVMTTKQNELFYRILKRELSKFRYNHEQQNNLIRFDKLELYPNYGKNIAFVVLGLDEASKKKLVPVRRAIDRAVEEATEGKPLNDSGARFGTSPESAHMTFGLLSQSAPVDPKNSRQLQELGEVLNENLVIDEEIAVIKFDSVTVNLFTDQQKGKLQTITIGNFNEYM